MRLIDTDALIETINTERRLSKTSFPKRSFVVGDVLACIYNAPTVDAVPVKCGRWEKAHIAGYLKCNCCKDAFIYEEWLESGKRNYCPNCGAKMDGDGNGTA